MSRIEGAAYEPDFSDDLLAQFRPQNQEARSAPQGTASTRPSVNPSPDLASLSSQNAGSATAARPETAKALSDAYSRLAFHEARLEIAREAVSLPKAKDALAQKYGSAFAGTLPERIRAAQTALKNEMRNVGAKLREMGVDTKSVTGPLGIPVREAMKFIKQQATVKNEAKSDRCDIARKAAEDYQEIAKIATQVADAAADPAFAAGAKTLSHASKGAAFVINAVCWGLDKSFVNNIDNMLKTLGYAPR